MDSGAPHHPFFALGRWTTRWWMFPLASIVTTFIAFMALIAFVALIVFLAFIATLPVVLYVSVKFGSDETTFTSVVCQTAPGTGMLGTGTGTGHWQCTWHWRWRCRL